MQKNNTQPYSQQLTIEEDLVKVWWSWFKIEILL